MFIAKKKDTKSWKNCKYLDNLSEEDLTDLFEENEVYRLQEVTKDNALEVQKKKVLDDLMKKQQELANQIAELSGQKVNMNISPVVQEVAKPNVTFLKETEANTTIKVEVPVLPTNPTTNKSYTQEEFIRAYGEFKDMAEKREEVVNVQLGTGKFIVELTDDIKLANTHRGIPLHKKFF